MKHRLKFYSIAVCCVGALTACQEEAFEQVTSQGNVTILARMSGGMSTRTCVDPNSPADEVGILWLPKDAIGVFGSNGTKNALFQSTNTTNVAEAQFTGTMAGGEIPTVAYYPYSVDNNSGDVTALKGNLKLTQTFDMTTGKLEGDYKVGTPTFQGSDGTYEFEFEHLFSLLKFDIDATGTALEGDQLEQIVLTLPEERRLGGEFTFDATTKGVTWTGNATGANELTMVWSDKPALTDGKSYTGYITCAPNIHKGDAIKITILTQKFKAEFTREALVDFAVNTCYTFPLSLENFKNDMEVTNRPVIASFSFEVGNNKGKILDKKLVFSNGSTRPEESSGETLNVDGDVISGCIPYLYDFKLKPTFEVAEGVIVTVDGEVQTSGVTEQDFSKLVTYTVSDGTDSQDYTVTVTNTGLPVVVLTQSGDGSVSWPEAGLNVRSKESDWVDTDVFSVYNADGTENVAPRACGFRLRGNTSQEFPKLPFAVKLDKKCEVLGMPEHKRWVLLANWMDRTMLRNAVTFDIAHRTADAAADGLGWNPRGTSVELVINGRHVGNYYLCEQIKIDGDRVDIQDCYEDVVDGGNANPSVGECGYLLEFDDAMDEANNFRTDRGLPCMFKDEVPPSSIYYNYVKEKVEGIEANLESGNYTEAYKDLDISSVIDYFFVQELVLNDEYRHPKSVYMYIDGEGKLTAGPVWDFDWQTFVDYDRVEALRKQYGNTRSCRKLDEWLYGASKLSSWGNYENDQPYMWYPLLFKDASFRQQVQQRWQVIYPALLEVTSTIDKLAVQNRTSDKYNTTIWSMMEVKANANWMTTWVAFNGDDDLSFEDAMELMKQTYLTRLNWMNTSITSGSFVTDAE
ncbi:MAG TPA: CotH kinase family protein [Bacteroides mediterraneensis]|uniref:CotH kinase family protein n=1 Tax=Bacteroides mediterraneensis TaxID=1841856 RepID=UPI0026EEF320|nr:CotH kinase family protein [Bacteroides mediterraneensis]HJH65461.1 CotH kinase family protein [Bacteroides mediterraneensis]